MSCLSYRGQFFCGVEPDCRDLKCWRFLRPCTEWLITWHVDLRSVWAAAAGKTRPFYLHTRQRNSTESHPPTQGCTHHAEKDATGDSPYQRSTLWPLSKVKAVIIDITVIGAFDLTFFQTMALSAETARSITSVCLRDGEPEWRTTTLTFLPLGLIMS